MSFAVSVEDLGKRYRVDAPGVVPGPHWALRHVSLSVEPGEVFGIVGRNGAGKSTLLRVLAGITDPSEGSATLAGSVRSLLEAGAGFHPDLTGRENVRVNARLMGLGVYEVEKRMDAIVSFAGVGEFIDTLLRNYSSGMHLRLAFAVAVHVEPDVMLVDDVLAAGDAEFQGRCLQRILAAGRAGRTVLLVSHDQTLLREACARVLWLEAGGVRMLGRPAEVLAAYSAAQPAPVDHTSR